MAAVSEEVESIHFLSPLHWSLHGYALPFGVLYAIYLAVWQSCFSGEEYVEGALIGLAAIALMQSITALFCVWSVHVRALLTCRKVTSVGQAKLVKVVPTRNNGSPEIVTLHHDIELESGEEHKWFVFQKLRYVYHRTQEKFAPVQYPVDCTFKEYLSHRGLETENDLAQQKQKFGLNRLNIDSPDFLTLFKERATAPFFVFQVFCVGLWCLEEYWQYSVFTLVMLVIFEAILVKQQQKNQALVRSMSSKPYSVQVYRKRAWCSVSSVELLPGDIISIVRNSGDNPVPCDILLLQGSCIVDEALLTGESVPQMKESVSSSQPGAALDLERDSRLHLISAGTKIVQHTTGTKQAVPKPPNQGSIGYVLRTGFSTSQGRLLRTILYSVKRVTANNLESFLFILFLLVFAVAAASYVWIKGTEDPSRNRYKLLLECVLIITSVVPPELPIELSLAVNSSLVALTKMGIFCTEPFRIPFAGKVDVCCFDKTGTLTSDSLVVHGVAGINPDNPSEVTPVSDVPLKTKQVLASCHALAQLDEGLVGDPLEKAALNAVDWLLTKSDSVCSRKDKKQSLKIIQRFHFSSSLKRMSVICAQFTPGSSDTKYIATVKGAAETLRPMFKELPKCYNSVYTRLSSQGFRILALGHKYLGSMLPSQALGVKRNATECDLEFAGFVAFSSPFKVDSKLNIKCIQQASHHVVMITGDNPLTACHVAKELKITNKRQLLILTRMDNAEWHWRGVQDEVDLDFDPTPEALRKIGKSHDLCVTGDGINYLQDVHGTNTFKAVVPFVRVFARVAPKQKQLVVTTLKDLGFYTLMCGDGTNDVGALKHAHIDLDTKDHDNLYVGMLKTTCTLGDTEDHLKFSVALLSGMRPPPSARSSDENSQPNSTSHQGDDSEVLGRRPLHGQPVPQARRGHRGPLQARRAPSHDSNEAGQRMRTLRNKLERDLNEASAAGAVQPVKLGDASIASPFTYKHSSIRCICHIIKQGRCTLVTTLQMFKILALNALVLAYSQSVLYIDGIKFSDTQYTIQGILLAICFLFISQSKPLDVLSKERPLTNIFNLYTVFTVLAQFGIHFAALVFLSQAARQLDPQLEEFVDLEKDFEQGIVNSAIFLIAMSMQLTNFAINYHGKPFMVSLTDNKPLLFCLLGTAGVVLALASGIVTDFAASLEVVQFPEEFRNTLLFCIVADFSLALLCDRALQFMCGSAKLRDL